ncbi:MAG: SDR family oxidoreductase [Nanoarchaeota archaeon]
MEKRATLEGKIAIVTGASEGIGFGIASALAFHGSLVYLVARTKDKLEEAENKIRKSGGKAESKVGDITKIETITKIIDEVYSTHNKLDIFVNNAGTWKGQSLETPFEEIEALINFDMLSPYRITHYLAQKFKHTKNNLKILTVLSQASLKVFEIGLGYGPAKMGLTSALFHLEKEIEEEKIKNITLYRIYPNTVATEKVMPFIKQGKISNPVSTEAVISTAIDLLLERTPTRDARIGYYPERGIVETYLASTPEEFYKQTIISEKVIDKSFNPDIDL